MELRPALLTFDAWYGHEIQGVELSRGELGALVHLATGLHFPTRRGGMRGAMHLLSQATVSFDDYRPEAHGVDVERLVTEFTTHID